MNLVPFISDIFRPVHAKTQTQSLSASVMLHTEQHVSVFFCMKNNSQLCCCDGLAAAHITEIFEANGLSRTHIMPCYHQGLMLHSQQHVPLLSHPFRPRADSLGCQLSLFSRIQSHISFLSLVPRLYSLPTASALRYLPKAGLRCWGGQQAQPTTRQPPAPRAARSGAARTLLLKASLAPQEPCSSRSAAARQPRQPRRAVGLHTRTETGPVQPAGRIPACAAAPAGADQDDPRDAFNKTRATPRGLAAQAGTTRASDGGEVSAWCEARRGG